MSNPTELPDLDACPFCGSPAHASYDPMGLATNGRVHCTAMDCRADVYSEKGIATAIAMWNRRAQPEGEAPQAAEVAAFNAWAVSNGSKTTAEFELGGDGQGYLNAFRAGAKFAATLSPLCGAQHAASGKEDAVELPSNEELEHVWENHVGHPADFAADVLQRWGGWQQGLLGYGGKLAAALAAQQAAAPATSADGQGGAA